MAEVTTTAISKQEQPSTFEDSKSVKNVEATMQEMRDVCIGGISSLMQAYKEYIVKSGDNCLRSIMLLMGEPLKVSVDKIQFSDKINI